jgi:hypothetical protein
MDKKKKIYCTKIFQLCPIVFLVRVGYGQYAVGKRRKHAGKNGMFQYEAEERSRGLSFSSSAKFLHYCEDISLTCRQLHLREKVNLMLGGLHTLRREIRTTTQYLLYV